MTWMAYFHFPLLSYDNREMISVSAKFLSIAGLVRASNRASLRWGDDSQDDRREHGGWVLQFREQSDQALDMIGTLRLPFCDYPPTHVSTTCSLSFISWPVYFYRESCQRHVVAG